MGVISRTKKIGASIFNFRVTKWISLDYIKNSYGTAFKIGKAVFTPDEAEYTESFEEALDRMQLTEEILAARLKEFTKLMLVYVIFAFGVFAYSVFIAYTKKNLLGFCMGFGITVYSLTHAFRYHFWIYQIKNRKLGCSIREWFFD